MDPRKEIKNLSSEIRQAELKLMKSSSTGKSKNSNTVVKIQRGKITSVSLTEDVKLSPSDRKTLESEITEAVNDALRKRFKKTQDEVNRLVENR